MERFSRKLYHILDHLGYNPDMIQFRRETWKYFSDIDRCIIAGSKGEGITSVLESDLDIMSFDNTVQCIYTTEQLPRQLPNHMIVFLADMENTPPGYTRLKLHRPASIENVRDKELRKCLFKSQGELASSSVTELFTKECRLNPIPYTTVHDISGPAIPSTTLDAVDIDGVLGMTFHCPQLLQIWASRRRQHEWPSEDTIRTACSFLPQVVPVGAKGSDRKDLEWRFCFIESELALTHSLNGTQIKLYVLLKMIAKDILKPVTSEISSYIMKNLIYWLSELLPVRVFREDKLASLVLLALKVLRTAITRWQNLPYYMIPSRNLLSERLDVNTRSELSDVLYTLIQEEDRLFLRIEKLRPYLEIPCLSPYYLVQFGNIRDQFEKLFLTLIGLRKLNDFIKNPLLICFNEGVLSLRSSIKQLPLQVQHDLFDRDNVLPTLIRLLQGFAVLTM